MERNGLISVSVDFPTSYVGYRCLHMGEGGDTHEEFAPAVHNSINISGVSFTRSMQLLSYEINNHNPNFTTLKWRNVWSNGTAFTNKNGFDKDGDPRVDFVNGINIGAPYPRVMRGLIMSGSLYKGVVEGSNLVMYPGIHAIDTNKPMPTAQEVLERGWYFRAVNASVDDVSHFSQGVGVEVRIPLFLPAPARYPLSWFHEWNESYPPDPLVFYN